jgi:hypothetical protein
VSRSAGDLKKHFSFTPVHPALQAKEPATIRFGRRTRTVQLASASGSKPWGKASLKGRQVFTLFNLK